VRRPLVAGASAGTAATPPQRPGATLRHAGGQAPGPIDHAARNPNTMDSHHRFLAIALSVFTLLGAGLLWAGWAMHRDQDHLLTQGVAVTATVVAVHTEQRTTRHPDAEHLQNWQPRQGGERGVYVYTVDVPVLRFSTRRGEAVEVRGQAVNPGEVSAGSHTEMLYLPEAPHEARERSVLEHPVGVYALWALGSGLLLPGLVMLLQRLRHGRR